MSVYVTDRTNLQLDVPSENKDAVSFWKGATLSAHPAGSGCRLADATALSRRCIGLATLGASVGFAENIRTEGWLESFDWTLVTDSVALSPNTFYFLSLTPGKLTATAPTVAGQIAQRIGISLNSTLMQLSIGEPITL